MKYIALSAALAASFSVPAMAQDTEAFTGPRAGVTMGFDKIQGDEGFSYGVNAGYDVAVAPRITVGPEVSFGDSTTDSATTDVSRDITASLRAGYVVAPKVLAFGKVGYTSTRFEPVAGGNYSLEGVRYGGGLEYAVTPKTYISAEYQRTEYEANFGGRDAAVVGVGMRF
ncbi:porin family protein [Novosphingobium aerophilum]|uniref:porin family protein n=1 Tax=Novosphingobium TaxID=165696 RepID=UPI0006C847D5|nr:MULTISPECIES: porin family protein [unclassified Novosphingobium]KPH58128.1 membrane protein [Novosphingobium sp. ST904]MPS67981.1 porin family protein [Novosphingobium sp.]WRT95438.1 porin family protein [Novosphingobium sp. RL4]